MDSPPVVLSDPLLTLDPSVEAERLVRAWPELTPFGQAVLSTGAELLAHGGVDRVGRWLRHLSLIDSDRPVMRRRDPVPEVAVRRVYFAGACKTARHHGFLKHLARRGFEVSGGVARVEQAPGSATRALRAADATVLLLPADGGAHVELGYAIARGQRTAVLFEPLGGEERAHYKLAGLVTADLDAVERYLFGTRSLGKVGAA